MEKQKDLTAKHEETYTGKKPEKSKKSYYIVLNSLFNDRGVVGGAAMLGGTPQPNMGCRQPRGSG